MVCMVLCCAVEVGSQEVMLEVMLPPLFPILQLNGDAQTRFKMEQLRASFLNRVCSKENIIRKRSQVLHTVKPLCM